MEDIRKRIRQAMEWLKDNRLFASNRAIAERMGYNPSVVSQVITGKSNVSERFVKSLCGVCPTLNFGWIWSGEGEMLLESPGRKQETETGAASPPPQLDRFSYILADMAEIMRNMTSMMVPLSNRIDRLEQKVEVQAREIESLRGQLAGRGDAATSRRK